MSGRVTVVMPVGPAANHRRYLTDAVISVALQTERPELLLLDDMAGLSAGRDFPLGQGSALSIVNGGPFSGAWLWRAPWRLGVPAAFNAGVALAPTEFVLMMGADDELAPDCIERVEAAIDRIGEEEAKHAYLYLPLRYMDTGEEQRLPCNAAVVSQSLWRATGGFAPESAVGACDTMFVSVLMTHPELARLLLLDDGPPVYHYRRHAETDTATRSPAWQGPILAARDLLAREWQAPNWGRYAP